MTMERRGVPSWASGLQIASGAARIVGGTADKAGSFLVAVQAGRPHYGSAGLYAVSLMRFNAGSRTLHLPKSLPSPREFARRTCRSCRTCVIYHVSFSLAYPEAFRLSQSVTAGWR